MTEKVLIPLPPARSASWFCAKHRLLQTKTPPRHSAGHQGRSVVARHARFCNEVQFRLAQQGKRSEVNDGLQVLERGGGGALKTGKMLAFSFFSASTLG